MAGSRWALPARSATALLSGDDLVAEDREEEVPVGQLRWRARRIRSGSVGRMSGV
jgi:hypothetical protein